MAEGERQAGGRAGGQGRVLPARPRNRTIAALRTAYSVPASTSGPARWLASEGIRPV
jgi:hypothetical protein